MRVQFLRSLRSSLARDYLASAGWLLVGTSCSRLAVLLATVALSRDLTQADFGRLALIQSLILLLGGTTVLGLAVGVTRQIAAEKEDQPAFASAVLRATVRYVAGGVLALTAVCALRPELVTTGIIGDENLTPLLRASVGAIATVPIVTLLQAAMLGMRANRSVAISHVALGGLSALGLVVGGLAGNGQGALAGLSLGCCCATAVAALLYRGEVSRDPLRPRTTLSSAAQRNLWRVSLPAFGSFVAVAVAIFAAQAILSHQAQGYREVAVFSVAYRWHLVLLFVPAAIAPVLVPLMTKLLSNSELPQAASLFRTTLALNIGVTAIPAIVFIALSDQIMALHGPSYEAGETPLVVLAVASVVSAVNNVLSGTAISEGALTLWLFSDVVLGGILAGLAALLAEAHGAAGVSIAYLAAYAASCLVLFPFVKRRLVGGMAEGA